MKLLLPLLVGADAAGRWSSGMQAGQREGKVRRGHDEVDKASKSSPRPHHSNQNELTDSM